jgi:hypothetical protein
MAWQDGVIATVIVVFTLTTIPMILREVTPPLLTSAPMVVGSVVLSLVYITLGLPLAMAVEWLSVTLWGILMIRRLYRR